jgi:2Fe-2S ferredoxin
MPKITFIEHNATAHTVEAEVDRSVMQAAIDHGVPGIIAQCGGCCSCGTCHGFIDEAWLPRIPPAQAEEKSLVEGLIEVQDNSRLTCQITMAPGLDGLVIRLPKSQT